MILYIGEYLLFSKLHNYFHTTLPFFEVRHYIQQHPKPCTIHVLSSRIWIIIMLTADWRPDYFLCCDFSSQPPKFILPIQHTSHTTHRPNFIFPTHISHHSTIFILPTHISHHLPIFSQRTPPTLLFLFSQSIYHTTYLQPHLCSANPHFKHPSSFLNFPLSTPPPPFFFINPHSHFHHSSSYKHNLTHLTPPILLPLFSRSTSHTTQPPTFILSNHISHHPSSYLYSPDPHLTPPNPPPLFSLTTFPTTHPPTFILLIHISHHPTPHLYSL